MGLIHHVSVVVLVEIPFEITPPQSLEYGLWVTAISDSGCSLFMVGWRVEV